MKQSELVGGTGAPTLRRALRCWRMKGGKKGSPARTRAPIGLPLGLAALVALVAAVCAARPDLALRAWAGALGLARKAVARVSGAAVAKTEPAAPVGEPAACEDDSIACPQWARLGECTKNPKFMAQTCALSCGMCGKAPRTKKAATCVDSDTNCESWALTGQCVKNPEYMTTHCRKSCGVCGPYGPACERLSEAALQPGDMNETFERALVDFPEYAPAVLHRDPWVVRFDNFLSDEEADHIVALCADSFQRSLAGDRVSSVRTSDQCWCNWGACLDDPVIQTVEERIAKVTRVPVVNGEFMQIVRYGEGQFCARLGCASRRRPYRCACAPASLLLRALSGERGAMARPAAAACSDQDMPSAPAPSPPPTALPRGADREHHDQNSASWSPQGVRVYTFFMYLNDVPEGGETAFRRLGLKVKPKKGAAILWPSVRDQELTATEQGTYHEAMPVIEGVKYGANVWLHMHDFRSVSQRHCLFTMKNVRAPAGGTARSAPLAFSARARLHTASQPHFS